MPEPEQAADMEDSLASTLDSLTLCTLCHDLLRPSNGRAAGVLPDILNILAPACGPVGLVYKGIQIYTKV